MGDVDKRFAGDGKKNESSRFVFFRNFGLWKKSWLTSGSTICYLVVLDKGEAEGEGKEQGK